MYNIVNQLGKNDFSCGLVVNNLKGRKFFFDQMNRNRFDSISARRDRNWLELTKMLLKPAVIEVIW